MHIGCTRSSCWVAPAFSLQVPVPGAVVHQIECFFTGTPYIRVGLWLRAVVLSVHLPSILERRSAQTA